MSIVGAGGTGRDGVAGRGVVLDDIHRLAARGGDADAPRARRACDREIDLGGVLVEGGLQHHTTILNIEGVGLAVCGGAVDILPACERIAGGNGRGLVVGKVEERIRDVGLGHGRQRRRHSIGIGRVVIDLARVLNHHGLVLGLPVCDERIGLVEPDAVGSRDALEVLGRCGNRRAGIQLLVAITLVGAALDGPIVEFPTRVRLGVPVFDAVGNDRLKGRGSHVGQNARSVNIAEFD